VIPFSLLAKRRRDWHWQCWKTLPANLDFAVKQSAADEMRIAHRVLQRRHDGDAAIGSGKDRSPLVGAPFFDDGRDGLGGRVRIFGVVDVLGIETDRLAESIPEFRFERRARR
jgi:hypothetical protein